MVRRYSVDVVRMMSVTVEIGSDGEKTIESVSRGPSMLSADEERDAFELAEEADEASREDTAVEAYIGAQL